MTNGLCEHEQKQKNFFASLRATQKFGQHEQASTRLNFASKSNKGKILRAVKNFNGTSASEQKGVMQRTGTLLRNVACFRLSSQGLRCGLSIRNCRCH